jgi:probable phosphoglycerate mutase
MTALWIIRHGPTAWNVEHRLQGRADLPLSPEGRAALAGRVVPAALHAARWIASPLARAVETAILLSARAPELDDRLIEMDWGAWEGRTVTELRAEGGARFAAAEAKGLDLQPPGGESPRTVQARLRPFLQAVAAGGRDTVAISHKGVARALLALATDWPMLGRPPVRLDWSCAHLFRLDETGKPTLEQPNIELAAPSA